MPTTNPTTDLRLAMARVAVAEARHKAGEAARKARAAGDDLDRVERALRALEAEAGRSSLDLLQAVALRLRAGYDHGAIRSVDVSYPGHLDIRTTRGAVYLVGMDMEIGSTWACDLYASPDAVDGGDQPDSSGTLAFAADEDSADPDDVAYAILRVIDPAFARDAI